MAEEYRNGLIAAEQKSQDDYDKTIVSLSGGALGISLIFIKDIVGDSEPVFIWAVVTAWALWASSITSVIISYFLSRMALRKAIIQADNNDFSGGVGGCAAIATHFFNIMSGSLFVLGIVFLITFSANNIGNKAMSNDGKTEKMQKGYVPPPPPKAPPTPDREPLTEGVIPPPPPPPPVKDKGKS